TRSLRGPSPSGWWRRWRGAKPRADYPWARAPRWRACRVRLSAKRAVDGDLVQNFLENGQLVLVEFGDEQFRDPAQVHAGGLGEARHAGVGQLDDHTAPVRIGVGAPDEAFLDQPGHTPGHA